MNSNLGFLAGVVAEHGMPARILAAAHFAETLQAAYPVVLVEDAAPGEEHLIRVYLADGTTLAATASME